MAKPNFANQTIWTGDNLDILRGMNSETIDLIYLDPPFNSNRNYEAPIGSPAEGAEFKDIWTLDDLDVAWHGEIAEKEPALYSVIDAAGLSHGKGMKAYLIMMAVRLLEMKRVLKTTGSIYLHCDDTAGSYLRMVMDAIFEAKNRRNEIVWKRNSANNAGKNFGRIAEILLYYTKGNEFTWNYVYGDYSEAALREYSRIDENGRRWKGENLTAPAGGNGARRFTWRGATPKHGWRYSYEKLEELYESGRIHVKKNGVPSLRGHIFYLDESPGSRLQNIWTDIPKVGGTSAQNTDYPTQKPLALLERIIKASSNEGDLVLDPFCGCATACVAAEKLERQWVGIDISPKAADLVGVRLRKELGLFWQGTHRTDVPPRTDLGNIPPYNADENKRRLYGEQEGHCSGCLTLFPYRNLTIDHVVPRAKGGTDHIANLQLLCQACNSTKGTGTQEELLAKLRRDGIRRD